MFKNSVVHIPKQYQQLNQKKQAKLVVSYNDFAKKKLSTIAINTAKRKFNKKEANTRYDISCQQYHIARMTKPNMPILSLKYNT